jgi:photosystem II stability/assembly factor-like uncharacterized protein
MARTRALLIGTAKGGFALVARGRSWRLEGPYQFGSRVHDLRADPRDGRTWLLCSTGGHLGPTIFRSTNRGRTWKEARRPPRFEPRRGRSKRQASRGQAVAIDFWLEPGHASERGVWYAGTAPPGLFRSTDGGRTWRGVAGFNLNPSWGKWTEDGTNASPEGQLLHSIQVDARDPRHLYLSMSMGGTFESRDRGRTWKPLNRGVAMDFKPPGRHEYGHDPHCMIVHPADPDRLYQQNHCGLYRLDRARGETWERIGKRMPKAIGDIGFPVVPHPADPDRVWVFPMDGTELWPRTSPHAKPAVYETRDGGRTWKRLDRGLPREQGWFTVLRTCMCSDGARGSPTLFFGTTSGQVWMGRKGGARWTRIAEHLPRILSLRHAVLR